MKASELKKDKMVSVRINSELKEALEGAGLSVQKVLDKYLDSEFSLTAPEIKVKGTD